MSSCTANDAIGCTSPSDCATSDAGSECCGTAVTENNPDGAAFPHCSIASLTSYCGTCTTNVKLNCTSTDTLQVCTSGSQCGANACCTIDNYHVCVPSILSGSFAPCLP
jgi:hypothetical protein